jgi:4-amino-4-deoxy-L-arabinose transferase-like glycosyltransferase
MMVSCLVFASVAALLGMKREPSSRQAIALGVLMGLGYLVKGIFLPLSLAFLGIECAILWRREKAAKLVAITLASMAIFAVPYAAGLTWAYGRPTFGEVGSLNYAWYVNGLQMDAFWEGGPAELGKPLHPPQQVSELPSIYLFDGPHAVTYAPWFNPPYYFEGYRHFFNLKNQIREVVYDLHALGGIFMRRLVLYVLIAAVIWRWRKAGDRSGFLTRYSKLWPLPAAAFLGLTIYVLVYLQPRHVASFVSLTLLALCMGFVEADDAALDRRLPARWRAAWLALLAVAWIATVATHPGEESVNPLAHPGRLVTFQESDQWKAGQYLLKTGLHPGDKVAWIADYWELTHYTWAYIAHLKLIGQVGGEMLEPQRDDLGVFWHSGPEERRRMLEVFHLAGARLVLALRMPAYADTSGWERVPETNMWVYRF